MINIDELLELEAKATPGPWTYADILGNPTVDKDLKLTQAMRNNIKPLLEELKAARKVVETARSFVSALELVQTSGIDISRGWNKELALQTILKELDSCNNPKETEHD